MDINTVILVAIAVTATLLGVIVGGLLVRGRYDDAIPRPQYSPGAPQPYEIPAPSLDTINGLAAPPGQMRLDAAVPEQVAVHVPFDLAIAARLLSSSLLRVDELTHTESGDAQVEWPEGMDVVDLRAYVHAPDCRIDGQPFQLFRLHAGQDSPIVYFSLTPLRMGSIPIRVTLYQSLLAIGTTRLTAEATERVAGVVETVVKSGNVRLLGTPGEDTVAARELYSLLVRAFSMEELESLCFEMNIDADNLTGTTRQRKASALVDYCRRHRRVDELIDRVIEKRPNWLELLGEV